MEEPQFPPGLPSPVPRRRLPRRAVAVAMAVVAVVVGFWVTRMGVRPKPRCGPEVPNADSSYAGGDTLGRNEVLAGVLARWCLSQERINEVYSALGRTDFNFRNMQPGDVVSLLYRGLDLTGVVYHKDLVTSYSVSFDSTGTRALKETRPVDTVRAVVRGAIKGSLWNTLVEQGESPSLVVNFATILSYEVDFLTETNEGDSFEILLDRYYVDSIPWRDGRVYAVHYRGAAGNFHGFYYRDQAGHWDYFNDKGQSLRKTVLRSPLTFANVTSSFGRRFHPISRVWRQHTGIDYGAPTGTPVAAIADGTVEMARWNGGYGNFVRIRHSGGLVSCYGHLSRYGAGAKAGRSVRQGQTIGYVGSTGFSTGPHLHFEVRRSGSPVNPLKVIPPRAEPVAKRNMPEFERAKASYLAGLAHPAGPIRPPTDSAAVR
jgi:murein DD-endopeptidase MepM/ murein hydrolase activator NlpD